MKVRFVLWAIAAIAGLINGALGTRFAVSVPDIYQASDIPFLEYALFIPMTLLVCWGASALYKSRSILYFHALMTVCVYGIFYGLFELAFHQSNQRPVLTSITTLVTALTLLGTLLLASHLFRDRSAVA